jgi:hypothetical protein
VRHRLSQATAVLAAFGLLAATAAALAGTSLQGAVLRPSQVGAGFAMRIIPGGSTVRRQVTLDMCGYHFRSEGFRTARLQTVYGRRGSSLSLSNEVVRYQAGGAALAMREIATAVRTCPPGPVRSTLAGMPPMTYRITRLSASGQNLLPGTIEMKVHESGVFNGKRVSDSSFVVYQRRGNVLSGIYVYGGSQQSRYALTIRTSQASARNLR